MNTQHDISSGPSVIPSPVFSLRSSAGFERINPQSARQGGASRSPAIRNPQSASGFTLVELLVIVSIIVLLIGLLLPALNKFRIAGKKTKVQAIINLIDGACQQYFTDFEDYPPSQDNDDYNGWTGSELIALFLTGYGLDTGGDGLPDRANLDADDGVDGYGFRLEQRGRVYGPYNGAEKLDTRIDTRPEFVDVFGRLGGNAILYYRYDGSIYNADHNNSDPTDPNSYAKDSDGDYYRTDFILISRGRNEDWNAPKDGGSDDVTNFFNR
ncbi:MAG: hypothetical protein KAV00_11835 [Phycisphaerae bacterium]|nr:hypothetical protein [Phycisphaerae bacterium]